MTSSQYLSQKFIPGQYIQRPNFERGTMGRDIIAGGGSPVKAQVVDRNVREAIQDNSKNSHFQFTAMSKSQQILFF